MEIHCKIGTHSSTVLRVKNKRKLPEKGNRITAMPAKLYNSLHPDARPYYWERYWVDDYNEQDGHRFYFLSL